MGSTEFDTVEFEKRLTNLKDTQEGIQSMSSWCLKYRASHKKIVSSWLNVLKQVKVEHRLILFYLANDVIQHSKRRNFEFVDSWGTTLQRATTMVRDDKVKTKILRIFSIWEQRDIYNDEFLSDLRDLLNINPAKKPPSAQQPSAASAAAGGAVESDDEHVSQLSAHIRTCVRLESATDQALKMASTQQPPAVSMRLLEATDAASTSARIQSLKDRRHVEDVQQQLQSHGGQLESCLRVLHAEVKARRQLIAVLEQTDAFFQNQRGEVKVVANAYRNFNNRVKTMKRKLDELCTTLPSPIPSPDINAPSPEPDNDFGLNLEDRRAGSGFDQNFLNTSANGGYLSFGHGKLPFDINDFKQSSDKTPSAADQHHHPDHPHHSHYSNHPHHSSPTRSASSTHAQSIQVIGSASKNSIGGRSSRSSTESPSGGSASAHHHQHQQHQQQQQHHHHHQNHQQASSSAAVRRDPNSDFNIDEFFKSLLHEGAAAGVVGASHASQPQPQQQQPQPVPPVQYTSMSSYTSMPATQSYQHQSGNDYNTASGWDQPPQQQQQQQQQHQHHLSQRNHHQQSGWTDDSSATSNDRHDASSPHYDGQANVGGGANSGDVDHRLLRMPMGIGDVPLSAISKEKSRSLDVDHRNLISLTGSPQGAGAGGGGGAGGAMAAENNDDAKHLCDAQPQASIWPNSNADSQHIPGLGSDIDYRHHSAADPTASASAIAAAAAAADTLQFLSPLPPKVPLLESPPMHKQSPNSFVDILGNAMHHRSPAVGGGGGGIPGLGGSPSFANSPSSSAMSMSTSSSSAASTSGGQRTSLLGQGSKQSPMRMPSMLKRSNGGGGQQQRGDNVEAIDMEMSDEDYEDNNNSGYLHDQQPDDVDDTYDDHGSNAADDTFNEHQQLSMPPPTPPSLLSTRIAPLFEQHSAASTFMSPPPPLMAQPIQQPPLQATIWSNNTPWQQQQQHHHQHHQPDQNDSFGNVSSSAATDANNRMAQPPPLTAPPSKRINPFGQRPAVAGNNNANDDDDHYGPPQLQQQHGWMAQAPQQFGNDDVDDVGDNTGGGGGDDIVGGGGGMDDEFDNDNGGGHCGDDFAGGPPMMHNNNSNPFGGQPQFGPGGGPAGAQRHFMGHGAHPPSWNPAGGGGGGPWNGPPMGFGGGGGGPMHPMMRGGFRGGRGGMPPNNGMPFFRPPLGGGGMRGGPRPPPGFRPNFRGHNMRGGAGGGGNW